MHVLLSYSDFCASAFVDEELQMVRSGSGDSAIYMLIKARMKLV